MIFLLSTTAELLLPQQADRITLCPPFSDFSVAPDSEDFGPDYAATAYNSFSSEPDYHIFVASDFRRDLTLPPESLAVPDTRPAYSNVPTITNNNDTYGPCSIGEHSYDIFVASTAQVTNHRWCTARVHTRAQIMICFRRVNILSDHTIVMILGWI